MTFKTPLLLWSCAGMLLVCPPAIADQYGPQAFAVSNGTTTLGDGTTIAGTDGTASVQNGALRLTQAGTSSAQ